MNSSQTNDLPPNLSVSVRNALQLTERDQGMLDGAFGMAAQMSMQILVTMATVYEADHLLDIRSAHIDGCLYHGDSGIDFAERLVGGGARVCVPTTLNVGAIDLLHPENFQGSSQQAARSQRIMDLYKEMGCRPIWTCTPYQVAQRPRQGMQIAWAESNAIVFANSVLGARTNRYGDFIDICAAITGRAPAAGLHLIENRRGQILFRLQNLPQSLRRADVFYPVIGYYVGLRAGSRIPVLEGLPAETTEDQLKALGAAAASSGAVALFHAVGITPEAPTCAEAMQGHDPEAVVDVSLDDLNGVRQQLSSVGDGAIQAVALGSPHFSLDEFAQMMPLIRAHPPSASVEFTVSTNRFVLTQLQERAWESELKALGVRLIVDTCVVAGPLLRTQNGTLMTNSGKFAHYTPGNTGNDVIFGSLHECIRSAEQGDVWRDERLWS